MFALSLRSVQLALNRQSQAARAGSNLGAMYSGVVESRMFVRACFTRSGLFIGGWPAAMMPALPYDAPSPTPLRSRTTTWAPRRTR